MEEKEENQGKVKCKKCGSGQTYIRIKERSVVCRSCANIDLMDE